MKLSLKLNKKKTLKRKKKKKNTKWINGQFTETQDLKLPVLEFQRIKELEDFYKAVGVSSNLQNKNKRSYENVNPKSTLCAIMKTWSRIAVKKNKETTLSLKAHHF